MMRAEKAKSDELFLAMASLLENTHRKLDFEDGRALRNLFNNVLMNLLSGFSTTQLGDTEEFLANAIIAYFERSAKSGIFASGNWFEMGLANNLHECQVEAELQMKAIRDLPSLNDWTLRLYKNSEERVHRYIAAEAAIAASQLSTSTQLLDKVSSLGGQSIVPTGKNIYLFYKDENSGVDPHIDRDEHEVNVLTVLEHGKVDRSTSAFMTVSTDLGIQPRHMCVGDWIAFYGGGTVHGRSNCSPGEWVVVLSMGFRVVL
jgi:hypothetical protein